MFAKLYGTDQDQVLVKVDSNDEGEPEIRFYTKPEGFGLCSLAISFEDSDEDSDKGWDRAYKALKEMTEEKARKMLSDLQQFQNAASLDQYHEEALKHQG